MDSRDVVTDVVATPEGEGFASVSWYKTVYVPDLTTRKLLWFLIGGVLLGCAGVMDWTVPAGDVEIVAGRRGCPCGFGSGGYW